MRKKNAWQSIILYYDLSPLELEVHKPRVLNTKLNIPRPYLVSKKKNGFLLSPITKQDKNKKDGAEKELENEPQKIKYWHQFALDLGCLCLKFDSFANLNTQILVPAKDMEEFNQNYLVDRRTVSEVHECLTPKKLLSFQQALTMYWSKKNKNLIIVEVDKIHNFLLTVFMPVRASRQINHEPKTSVRSSLSKG